MRLAPLLVALAVAAPASASPGVRVYQSSNPSITEGETQVAGDPATVYAVVQDYSRWVDVFPTWDLEASLEYLGPVGTNFGTGLAGTGRSSQTTLWLGVVKRF